MHNVSHFIILSDGRTGGRTDGRSDGRTDGISDGRTDGGTVGTAFLHSGFLEESTFVASIFDSDRGRELEEEEASKLVEPFHEKWMELKVIVDPILERELSLDAMHEESELSLDAINAD